MNKRADFSATSLEASAFWMPYTANRQFKKSPRLLVRAEGMHYWTADGRQILDGQAGLWCVNAGHCRPKIVAAIQKQAAFWMPFTANRQFKKAPRLLARAEGMYYWTPEGREVLDGTAGLWCVNAGHCRPKIVEAVKRQVATMDFAPTFQMGHPIAFEFAERLARIAPEGFSRVFFTNSGSESVDTALKIALAYHRARGEAQRFRLIGRERGYHGVNFGGMAVGGLQANKKAF